MLKYLLFILLISFNSLSAMDKKIPYHHVYENGKLVGFRNLPADVPSWGKKKWSWSKFSKLKKEINTYVPSEHLLTKEEILESIEKTKNVESIQWLGHNSWLLRNINGKNILFDPVCGETIGPMSLFGSKRYTPVPLQISELPQIDILIISHHHFDSRDFYTLNNLPNKKNIEAFVPLRSQNFYKSLGYKRINELDWDESKKIDGLTISSQVAYHWSKTSLLKRNDTLWSSYLLEWDNNKKIWLGGDSGYIKKIFDDVGKKIGDVSLAILGIGAYDFKKLGFDKTYMHTSPSEALQMGKSINAKKVIGSHFLTFVISLEPVLDPIRIFKENAEKFGYKFGESAIIFKIGEVQKLEDLIN